ncbi:hypothetical protein [Rhodohalobacter sulfatireducens]|uniref:Uncharacterized protein n=1 Tax=Rhodohalobacter sulfatireducens TaxID=2911366 RepID=A0ABS9KEX9_9BACT|nr:hypothetical protein [Rhodohalobacter sulfatireducens]MCG2589404.1 hypothetical protein [Rhodohalobacter sulfatireducens]
MRKNSGFRGKKIGLLYIWLTDFWLSLFILSGSFSSLETLYLSYAPVPNSGREISTQTDRELDSQAIVSHFNTRKNEKN